MTRQAARPCPYPRLRGLLCIIRTTIRKGRMVATDCTAKNRPFFMKVNATSKEVTLVRPRCKQWACPSCAKDNTSQWGKRAAFAITLMWEAGEHFWFVTLTSHAELETREATERVFPHAWSMLYKRMKRVKNTLKYIAIPEQHQDGRLHVHMVINHGFEERWLKDNGAECGLGYMVDVQPVDSVFAVTAYIIKYMRKHIGANSWSKGFRRVRTSAHFPKLIESHEDGWIMLVPKDVLGEIMDLLRDGYVLENRTNYDLYKPINADVDVKAT